MPSSFAHFLPPFVSFCFFPVRAGVQAGISTKREGERESVCV